ncbi:3-isopropylmalate dehydratase, small subunit [Marinococcus luteus]|jgi:3-isopropylmalate/(R)-2-methylmalate dehydratase small subunit|uniref:3-isopropylmalate dehydratase small subunit n=1 Tax=Marinococcus luteus TaxID=1122204 RepID=A0A1H2VIS4_9BACI|nr:3-isopropylmalate dehydratase small subunit [Marinococcus luteus]SDW68256.1 3-isopropylmalate dehydratase, small subunit [Marinococcus luteus]
MEALTVHEGNTAVLERANVDTDQIIPKQFLKRVERTGFGQFLFFDWRFKSDGEEDPSFELNYPSAANASILIADHNFGSGSSREHAPWALQDYGFRVIIAPSYSDIFYNNCVKNGILPVRLPEDQVYELMQNGNDKEYHLTVDLQNQQISDKDADFQATFEIDPYWKEMLLNGWDEISITLQYEEDIEAYEKRVKV